MARRRVSPWTNINGGYAGMPKMDPQARVGFSAHGPFKRSDFGIAFGVPAPVLRSAYSVDFSIEAEFGGTAPGRCDQRHALTRAGDCLATPLIAVQESSVEQLGTNLK